MQLEVPDAGRRLAVVRLVSDLPLSDDERAFVRAGDRWVLDLGDRRLHRLEYLLEVDGHTAPDASNPERAPGAFGEKSVWCAEDYRPPFWLEEGRHGVEARTTELHVRSRAIRALVRLRLWAPADATPEEALPLLVVLDGPEYERLASLTDYVATLVEDWELPRMRVALLEPGRRDERYSASTAFSRALCTEVVPAIGDAVAVRSRPVAMGASLGGLAVLHAQRSHPGTFAGLFLQSSSFFSPVHDAQESGFGRFARITRWVRSVVRADTTPEAIPVVLTCGTEEENIHNNREMAKALQRQGYDVMLVEVGDLHNYTAWRDAFDPHLTDLLTKVWA
jgi:enterochelin esterase-like enzyme